MRKARGPRGTSIVEMLVTLAVLMVVSVGVVGLSMAASKQWSRDTAKTIADDDLSLALQNLVRRVSDGKRASVSNGVLSVTMPYMNSNGDYDRFRDGETYTFYLENNHLYRANSLGAREILGRNVASVEFGVSGPTISIKLVSRKQTGTDQMESSVVTSATLRNYVD